MSWQNDTVNQQVPIRKHIIGMETKSVENDAADWAKSATEYPNGVFQLNANLND